MFKEFLSATQQLIAINSVEDKATTNAPFGVGVAKALDFALNKSHELGFLTKNGNGYYGFAEIGSGELFGMLGHLDTVPIGQNWTMPPLGGEIKDGVLYGRGVLDNKAPILACLYATAQLVKQGKVPKRRIRIIFGCDEESGWQCMDKYLETEELPVMAFTPDADFPVINCEKGIVYHDVKFPMPKEILSIEGGDRANMVMDNVVIILKDNKAINTDFCDKLGVKLSVNTLSASGVSAHGSTPSKGDNAYFKIVKVMADAYSGIWRKLADIIMNTDGSGYGLKLSDEESGHLTINIGKVEVVNNAVHMSLDIRYPISYTRDYITSVLKEKMSSFEVAQGFYHNPLYIDKEHELVVKLLEAYRKVTGDNTPPISIGGGTYARALPTAVAFGPIFPNQISTIHQCDECASIEMLAKMYEVYLAAIEKLCF